MQFKNDLHKKRFMDAIKKMDHGDNTQMAIVFLLTADRQLWNRCKIYRIDNRIPIHRVRVRCVKEDAYVLFCGARDLALGTTYISMRDLVDREVVSGPIWKLIFTALEIRRYGVGIVIPRPKNKKEGEKKCPIG